MAVKGMSEFRADGENYTINDPNIANEFSTSAAYAAGDYVYYQGNLYRFTAAHASGVWAGTDATQVKLGRDVSDLKSALYDINDGNIALTFIPNSFVNRNGGIEPYDGWKRTDYTDCSNSEKLIVTTGVQSSYNHFFDASKDPIGEYFVCFVGKNEIEIPDGAKYFILSNTNAGMDSTHVVHFITEKVNDHSNDINCLQSSPYACSNLINKCTFKRGSYEANGTLNEGVTYRVSTVEKINFDKDIALSIESGYRFFVTLFKQDSTVEYQSNWINESSPYLIAANKDFKLTISTRPEVQTTADIELFAKQIKYAINDISELNSDMLPFVRAIKSTIPPLAKSYFNATHTPLTFVHFSDNHAKPNLWKRTVDFANKYSSYIDFAIHTGDYVANDQRSDPHLYNVAQSSIPILNCVGNHDSYATENPLVFGPKAIAKQICFPYTSDWGVTFADIDDSMSYYKDFATSNIRLIVLDNYYDLDAQITWLNGLLADALSNNIHVITAAHQATGKPLTKYNTGFQTIIPYDTVPIGACVDTVFDEPISEFINSGGVHIVHIAGHEHQDWFFKSKKGVRNLIVECSTDWVGYTEGNRVSGIKTFDCFNVMGIDTDQGIFKVVRIGNNTDSANRSKNILSFDYVNDNILCSE